MRWMLLALIAVVMVPAAGSVQTFGTGGNTLPVITNITVYDISGLSGTARYTEGSLETYGTNTTLNITQYATTDYRVNITIENQGPQSWTLKSSDEIIYQGLDPRWTVNTNDIFYQISGGSRLFGGTYTEGNISWDTGNKGELTSGATLWANYIVEINNSASASYDGFARVADSKCGNQQNPCGSNDSHVLDVTKVGFLNMSLLEPPNSSIVQQNLTFTMNASIQCLDGQCGRVTATPRYGSTQPDTVMPEETGEPFHTTQGNQDVCSTDLNRGATCYSNVTVNATGNVGSEWNLDINASSSYEDLNENETGFHNVTIVAAVYMNLDFSSVSFGTPPPGTTDQPASRNGEGYNITNENDSRPVDGLWVKSTPLNRTSFSSYAIEPSNLSITDTVTEPNQLNLSSSYQRFKQGIDPGTVIRVMFFLDIPLGLMKGDYSGTITFKANTTQ